MPLEIHFDIIKIKALVVVSQKFIIINASLIKKELLKKP